MMMKIITNNIIIIIIITIYLPVHAVNYIHIAANTVNVNSKLSAVCHCTRGNLTHF